MGELTESGFTANGALWMSMTAAAVLNIWYPLENVLLRIHSNFSVQYAIYNSLLVSFIVSVVGNIFVYSTCSQRYGFYLLFWKFYTFVYDSIGNCEIFAGKDRGG